MTTLLRLLLVLLTISFPSYATLTTQYLGKDLEVVCSDDPTSESTTFTLPMEAGDTVLVRGHAYSNLVLNYPEEDPSWKELSNTLLVCVPGQLLNWRVANILSRTGTNIWNPDNLGAVHKTRAIYTAPISGYHTCGLVYKCLVKNAGAVMFSEGSFVQYYDVNHYPGINWISDSGEILIDQAVKERVEDRTWDAGTTTAADSEVVVLWSPHLTNCEVNETQCGEEFFGENEETHFRYQIVVYQYQGAVLCNANFGVLSDSIPCPHNDHHCGVELYSRAVPILTGQGSVADCGDSAAARKFRTKIYLMKTSDFESDIMYHGVAENAYINVTMYSR